MRIAARLADMQGSQSAMPSDFLHFTHNTSPDKRKSIQLEDSPRLNLKKQILTLPSMHSKVTIRRKTSQDFDFRAREEFERAARLTSLREEKEKVVF
jgi:hypothetical protein